jgi:hypothetical protein
MKPHVNTIGVHSQRSYECYTRLSMDDALVNGFQTDDQTTSSVPRV